MITEQDLTEAIAECIGKRNPDANTCIKLAAYYTIMRELYGDKNQSADAGNMAPSYSYSPPPTVDYSGEKTISYSGDSEFSDIVNGMNINDVLVVIEELMEVLRVANSSTGRLYNATLRKLKDI